jgi:hypothetical protein
LPSVRGDLLAKLGSVDEARVEFERAASLTRNARERALLLNRAAACARARRRRRDASGAPDREACTELAAGDAKRARHDEF